MTADHAVPVLVAAAPPRAVRVGEIRGHARFVAQLGVPGELGAVVMRHSGAGGGRQPRGSASRGRRDAPWRGARTSAAATGPGATAPRPMPTGGPPLGAAVYAQPPCGVWPCGARGRPRSSGRYDSLSLDGNHVSRLISRPTVDACRPGIMAMRRTLAPLPISIRTTCRSSSDRCEYTWPKAQHPSVWLSGQSPI